MRKYKLEKKKSENKLGNFPKPRQIKDYLDQYVIGQDKAKTTLSVAVYNHYKRANYDFSLDMQKSNILLIGPTGCGKTLLAETLAKFLDVPFYIADSTNYTEAGYEGYCVDEIIENLYSSAGHSAEKAEVGIVYLDEIDKLARRESHGFKDVSGEGVQQALLRLVEGKEISVEVPSSGPSSSKKKYDSLDTKNILFIGGGSFSGLIDLVNNERSNDIGFGSEIKSRKKTKDYSVKPRPEHLIKYGMIPEFMGRFPIIANLDHLGKNELVRILQEPKNAILSQYEALLELEGVKLNITRSACEAIAQKALDLEIGARGLRSIIEDVLERIMFELPYMGGIKECLVSVDCVTRGRKPRYKY